MKPAPYKSHLGKVVEFDLAGRRYQAFVPNSICDTTPVLITHDAQNYMLDPKKTWNGENWGVIDALNSGRIKPHPTRGLPLIVSVHLVSTSLRLNELEPEDFMREHPELWASAVESLKAAGEQHLGNAYVANIVENLLPYILGHFEVKLSLQATAIAGSSMGGVASMYAMSKYPDVFGAALAYSTHWVIGGSPLVEYFSSRLPNDDRHLLWTDRGNLDVDAPYAPFHSEFTLRMQELGWRRDENFMASVFYGTGHRENFWARRIELPINWWLSTLS